MAVPTNIPLLIDGDIFLYRCGFAVEKKKYLVTYPHPDHGDLVAEEYDSAKEAKQAIGEEKDYCTLWERRVVEPVENAITALNNSLDSVISKFWPKEDTFQGVIFLTGKGNFRELIGNHRTYKDNRDPAHRPTHYRTLKNHLVTKRGARVVNGEEADDAIGREAYMRNIDRYVIVSNDKDLDQLSGYHYDWTKDQLYFVDDEAALKNFYIQMLCGDSTDNIKGPISKARAEELIKPCSDPKECAIVAREVYQKAYGDEWGEMADEIGELVWIRRTDKPADAKLHNPFWDHIHAVA